MDYSKNLRTGMAVFSSDGKKLGKIVQTGADSFIIEKGLFFPKDYTCSYDAVSDLREDGAHLSVSSDDVERGLTGTRTASRESMTSTETRIPLAQEELEASKRAYQAGEVQVHKDVKTETAEVSIPLRHEEVRVERSATETREAKPGEATFEKSTTTIPVYEEEAEIRKRPVVREEVRVGKDAYTEERRASEEIRKETVDVESTGDVHPSEPHRKG